MKSQKLTYTGASCVHRQGECWDELGTAGHLPHHCKSLLQYWVDIVLPSLGLSFASSYSR